jgi:hypothetical protein
LQGFSGSASAETANVKAATISTSEIWGIEAVAGANYTYALGFSSTGPSNAAINVELFTATGYTGLTYTFQTTLGHATAYSEKVVNGNSAYEFAIAGTTSSRAAIEFVHTVLISIEN